MPSSSSLSDIALANPTSSSVDMNGNRLTNLSTTGIGGDAVNVSSMTTSISTSINALHDVINNEV